jgi:mannitol 2-dehydrogenase
MPLTDPYADRLREHALRGGDDPTALLSLREFFGELPDQPRFVAVVADHLARLYRDGARAALDHVLAGAA